MYDDILCCILYINVTKYGVFVSKRYSIQDIFYANIGDTDKSSDFTPFSSATTVTHDSDHYTIVNTASGYNPLYFNKLGGKNLNGYVLEFDVYIVNANDVGFGIGGSTSGSYYIGVGASSRVDYRNYDGSSDSYDYGTSVSACYNNWTHWKCIFSNNTMQLQIFSNNTLLYSRTVNTGDLSLSSAKYFAQIKWLAGTKYLKNITVKQV